MEDDSKKISIRLIVMCIIIALVVLFMILNRESVTINLLFGKMTIPIFMVIAISAILGWLVGFLVPKVRKKDK
ncbi:lipopolysaccharide assembly protein LapA domain-containing protein [Listeria goaensis]|uniref:lipopolysaccharide assembly protein LapA domain-containing protein n=1 Tax=Listeria goaensis TaxID=1649188 RepID=UPI000B596A6D|nr:LapA family protein [Listeria goaensis]